MFGSVLVLQGEKLGCILLFLLGFFCKFINKSVFKLHRPYLSLGKLQNSSKLDYKLKKLSSVNIHSNLSSRVGQ